MKNRKKASQIKAVTTIVKKLKAVGLQPTFHILDNELSTDLIEFLETDANITVQLAPAGFHSRKTCQPSYFQWLIAKHKTHRRSAQQQNCSYKFRTSAAST